MEIKRTEDKKKSAARRQLHVDVISNKLYGSSGVGKYGDEYPFIIDKDLKSISDEAAINKLRGAVSKTIAK